MVSIKSDSPRMPALAPAGSQPGDGASARNGQAPPSKDDVVDADFEEVKG